MDNASIVENPYDQRLQETYAIAWEQGWRKGVENRKRIEALLNEEEAA